MDAHPGMTDQEADRRLRGLFQQAGPLEAPDALEQRIMGALAEEPRPMVTEAPLLPRWVWPLLGAFFLALMVLSARYHGPADTAPDLVEQAVQRLRTLSLPAWTGAMQVKLVAMAIVLLAGVELVLRRPRTSAVEH